MKTSRIEHKTDSPAVSPAIARPETASLALRRVLGNRAAPCLKDLAEAFGVIRRMTEIEYCAAGDSAEMQSAFAEYRLLLREFKSRLPQLQGWLLAERARLAQRGAHSAAVEDWMQAHGQTR